MFSEYYTVVINWLTNQINAGKAETIFLNEKTGIRAFKKLDQNLAILDQDRSDLDHFISVHLNKSGIVKLKTTIRIYKKRQAEKNTNSVLLQCTLYASATAKLDKLVDVSGKTKMEIINQLIVSADLSEFATSSEEQLDLLKN